MLSSPIPPNPMRDRYTWVIRMRFTSSINKTQLVLFFVLPSKVCLYNFTICTRIKYLSFDDTLLKTVESRNLSR